MIIEKLCQIKLDLYFLLQEWKLFMTKGLCMSVCVFWRLSTPQLHVASTVAAKWRAAKTWTQPCFSIVVLKIFLQGWQVCTLWRSIRAVWPLKKRNFLQFLHFEKKVEILWIKPKCQLTYKPPGRRKKKKEEEVYFFFFHIEIKVEI